MSIYSAKSRLQLAANSVRYWLHVFGKRKTMVRTVKDARSLRELWKMIQNYRATMNHARALLCAVVIAQAMPKAKKANVIVTVLNCFFNVRG